MRIRRTILAPAALALGAVVAALALVAANSAAAATPNLVLYHASAIVPTPNLVLYHT